MSADSLDNGFDSNDMAIGRPRISLMSERPVRVWLVIGLLILYLLFATGLFFEAVSPVADFPLQPNVSADSATYWRLSGVRSTPFEAPSQQRTSNDPGLGNNTVGPVGLAKLFRTDFGVLVANLLLFLLSLWIVGSMPEFDRSIFVLLLLVNPLLISALVTLNKEIFATLGVLLFTRYTSARRFRFIWLTLALSVSFAARWEQTAVMLILLALESRVSPVRGHPFAGVIITVLAFTVIYGVIYRLIPDVITGFLIQAEAGKTILVLDNIQGRFGFPLVVIPKILLNVMGQLLTPRYFLSAYWEQDFTNWHDQIFVIVHEGVTTLLLMTLLVTRKLRLRDAPVYLLVVYLVMTAIALGVQPRYEYPAYVLLCLQASRSWRFGPSSSTHNALVQLA